MNSIPPKPEPHASPGRIPSLSIKAFLQAIWRLVKACLIAVGVLVLGSALLLGGCIINAERTQSRLLREGPPIVAAIQAFRKAQHRFPKNLAELNLPPSSVDRRWHYFGVEDGRFQIEAYTGMGRATIKYRNEPGASDMTGWFYDPEESPDYWTRLTPPNQ